jgi:glycosyltransferase domain-containing protein
MTFKFSAFNHLFLLLTKDRPNYLKITIDYYISMGCDLLIVDGSPIEFTCPSLKNPYIRYIHLPDASYLTRLNEAINYVGSSFVTLITDDDICIPLSAFECVLFMENHTDVYACGGIIENFSIKETSIIVHPWSHWSFPVDCTYNSPLERGINICKVYANCQTANYYYLTYRTSSFISLVYWISSFGEIFIREYPGIFEVLVISFNILKLCSCLLPIPYVFRGSAIGASSEVASIFNSLESEKILVNYRNPLVQKVITKLEKLMLSADIDSISASYLTRMIIDLNLWNESNICLYQPLLNCLHPQSIIFSNNIRSLEGCATSSPSNMYSLTDYHEHLGKCNTAYVYAYLTHFST